MNRTEWILFMTVMLAVAGFALPSPVMTPMFLDQGYQLLASDTGQTERIWWLMLAFGLYPVGQMLGGPYLGRLSDRWGRKPVLVGALIGVVLGYLVMALAIWQQWLWLLLLSRLWEGLCNGNVAIAQAMAADISSPERKPILFSRLNVALNMGWIVGPLFGGFMAEYGGGYTAPFIGAGVIAALNLGGVFWGLPAVTTAAQGPGAEPPAVRLSLIRLPQLRLYLLLTLLSYGAIMLYFNFFNVWLVERFAQTPFQLALAAVMISVPMMFGSWLAGRISGRLHLLWIGLLGHLLMTLGMLLFVVPQSLAMLYLVMAIAGVGITIGEQATSLGVSNNAPASQQGEAMGLYRALAMGSELLAAAMGALLVIQGTQYAYIGAAMLALLCVLIFLRKGIVEVGRALRPQSTSAP
ncbi:MFS transporter [Marinobacterium jannaschii]|uniref:MFS transporter n=1 Tax=Marinobacterium jannaschii TaxID=64970 RepID=UPI000569B1A3|nr:MFS transporter [Marinobacterium jannaschii]